MTDGSMTQKDLDLIADDLADDGGTGAATDKGADAGADKSADKGADKQAADKAATDNKTGDSVLDGLDDDAGDADAGKDKATKEKTPDAKAGEEGKAPSEDAAKDDAAQKADAAWRSRLTERLLEPLKDKLSAAKFEKRRGQIADQLKRYKSMDEAIISGMMAQEKLRSGEHRKAPEGGSEEEVTAWRKENGIPESAEAIAIPKVAGKEWTEADQPMIDSFRTSAFEAGINQEQVNRLVRWHVEQTQAIEAEYEAKLKKADKQDKEACHDMLRTEFGVAEFKPNMSVMKRLIEDDEVFGPAQAEFVSARYLDAETGTWRRLTSHPTIARALIGLATDRYGEGAMPSGDGRTTTVNRVAELEKLRDTNFDEYVRSGGADELMKISQAEEARAAKRGKR
jgi:hypothetical protein